jgi:hypothetical protein
VREGFIVDEDEDDEPEERERKRRKRRRAQREEEEAVLDEEDLDLIGEANPEWDREKTTQACHIHLTTLSFYSNLEIAQVQATKAWPP